MKKLLMTYITALILFMTLTIAGDKQEVENFVSRFYTEVLGRTADTAGLADWTNRLISGESAGSDVAFGFIFSAEFIDKKLNDRDFLTVLYKTFFGREADIEGLNQWLKHLRSGVSREEVLDGFLNSQEFRNLANSYGITANATAIELFVIRFYTHCLQRSPDDAGLADWSNRLGTQVSTGSDIATGFIFSDEFKNRNTDDVTFLEILYNAFFGREADEGGLNLWLEQLELGATRENVLNGFLYSQEFVNLSATYGIIAYTGSTYVYTSVSNTDETSTSVTDTDTVTIKHSHKIIFKNLNDPLNYGDDIFFAIEWDIFGDLAYEEHVSIIMTDGETEQTVGYDDGRVTRQLDCRMIGGYGDYYQLLTDDRVSYSCGSYQKQIIVFEKGEQYSFFLRYSKRGTETYENTPYLIPIITEESEISIVLEYADKTLSVH